MNHIACASVTRLLCSNNCYPLIVTTEASNSFVAAMTGHLSSYRSTDNIFHTWLSGEINCVKILEPMRTGAENTSYSSPWCPPHVGSNLLSCRARLLHARRELLPVDRGTCVELRAIGNDGTPLLATDHLWGKLSQRERRVAISLASTVRVVQMLQPSLSTQKVHTIRTKHALDWPTFNWLGLPSTSHLVASRAT